jgi:hypothetical protein
MATWGLYQHCNWENTPSGRAHKAFDDMGTIEYWRYPKRWLRAAQRYRMWSRREGRTDKLHPYFAQVAENLRAAGYDLPKGW